MADESDVIATFAAPPVVEVVTSVRFAAMKPATFMAFGAFWADVWRSDFPNLETQGPYEAVTETFNGLPQSGRVSFNIEPTLPLPRVWVSSPDGQHLLQIQRDWFAANWRRHGGVEEAEYDRWPARRAQFAKRWGQVRSWLGAMGEDPKAEQCEVTYINHIRPVESVWQSHSQVKRVFPGLNLGGGVPYPLENSVWRSQHLVKSGSDDPPARLHVSVMPAFAGPGPEPVPIFVLELTVRGAPGPEQDLLAFGDRARRVIVESFIGVTSAEMREAWRPS